ncbi:MAG: T9SS type A sorting domain-containing protein [Sphingomonadales bacterium]|nr:T9SS type A sorting domain-containing protein [Sphingomonadales bacterium]
MSLINRAVLLLVLLNFSTFLCSGQEARMGASLATRFIENPGPNTWMRITVSFKEQAPVLDLLRRYELDGTELKVRAQEVNRVCSLLSDRVQLPFLTDLETMGSQANDNRPRLIRRFWIVNMVELEVTIRHIDLLLRHPAVEEIELSSAFQVSLVEPVSGSASPEMPNGREVGLTAIGAPALWQMGYSGKGRKAMLMDTGVWPDHPALKGKFLGTRYPLSHAWLPYDFATPRDKNSNHGTHVIGTVLGLDTATRDTIGAAFDAYFLATDPIVTNIAFVRDWTQLMAAFEWALNPDGDTSTTHDIPDVINNSWGRNNAGFDSLCGHPLITSAMIAIEAAGIANVFSTGNDGPGLATTIVPAQVIIDSLNLFAVGAVQAAAPGYPLAGFSSWGPSRCTQDSFLMIKPEVSAPGVDVRSADGPTGYGIKSGTSMASPHVSGAVLLLKEAFPQLSGRQILNALYQSAIDLGVPGEDYQYGRGLINVPAAFQFLLQSNTPQPPARAYDLAIAGVDSPETAFFGSGGCLQTGPIMPPVLILRQRWRIEVMNRGDSILPGFRLFIDINGQSDTINHNNSVFPGQRVRVTTPYFVLNPPALPTGPAGVPNRLLFRAQNLAGMMERDTINNRWFAEFPTRNIVETRFYEAFDSLRTNGLYAHRIDDWVIRDLDADAKTWQIVPTGGRAAQSACVKMKDYGPGNGQLDELVSPLMWFSRPASGASGTGALSFDIAYSNRSTTFSDTLFLDWSTDCGATYQRLWLNGGDSMKTYNGLVPSDSAHWRRWQIPLPDSLLQPYPLSARIRFTTKNDWGGNLYLSNIQVYYQVASLQEEDLSTSLKIYPNPAYAQLNVVLPNAQCGKPLLYDALGRIQAVEWNQTDPDTYRLNTQGLPVGIYYIRSHSKLKTLQGKVLIFK